MKHNWPFNTNFRYGPFLDFIYLKSWSQTELRSYAVSSMNSVSKLKEARCIYISCVFYIDFVTLLATLPLALSQGWAERFTGTASEMCIHTWGALCVSACLCVYVHGVQGAGRGIAFTGHHLHFHTQFVMTVTRQGESWGSHRKKMAASTSQMGEEQGQWLGKGAGGGVALCPNHDGVNGRGKRI